MASKFKSKELFRLPTGIRNTTVPFYVDNFHGDPMLYPFKRMQKYYVALCHTLDALGLEFAEMGACNITACRAHFTLYAGTRENPVLIWERYEGLQAAGAQSRLYIAGRMFKMFDFFAMTEQERIDLIRLCHLCRPAT